MQAPDLDFIRGRFPGLAGDWAYMDNAGGSHVLVDVADRVRDFLLTTPVQHGASYGPSREASARLAAATARIAGMINAPDPSEVVIGGSSTFLLQQLARAMASQLRPGDEIVVTDVDHESNIGPWRALEGRGVVIREWRMRTDTFELELDDLTALLTDRTRLVAVTHCSNVLGTVMPIAEIARLVHAPGAELCVDGVAYAPHGLVDVQALGCDWYTYSFYKTFGPHQAVLWGRRERLAELDGLNHGFISKDQLAYKLLPGNVNYELAWGCAAIADYLEALGEHHDADPFAIIARQEEALAERLLGWLRRRNDVRIIGRRQAGPERVPTISFTIDGRRSSEIVAAVDRARIGIRWGDFYAKRLIERLELIEHDGVVRVSMVHYNTLDEVDRLIGALEGVVGG